MAELLIRYGASIINESSKPGDSPFCRAITEGKSEMVEFLINQGIHVNDVRLIRNLTPLHLACNLGKLAVVECLVNHGADVNATVDGKKLLCIMLLLMDIFL